MTETEKWTKRLSRYEYNMNYSNMTNDQALEIIDSIVSAVHADLDEDFSPVKDMIERAQNRFEIIKEARN